ncbi:hypothetical protein [Paenibacillus guangzhouensis]|uniref:hypothetical protein n=1 Tax=Paenibacillus guangzhouensis TaxID=1473112 RepID=UPI001266BC47|nr:hypothetical protein [Paenibacillus guangzhouensis]
MRVAITVKSIGKRKNALTRLPVELPHLPQTLREFITALVEWNVRGLQERQQQLSIVPYLSEREVEERAEHGKVGFGAIYHEGIPDMSGAIATAILAFEDGLYRVFIGDSEVESLDEPLTLQEDDEIALIRFTMLAGSFW